jgi:O-antigen/teichoic acid export membrane protein
MGLELFSDLGLRQNIIQHQRGSDPAFLNTIWTLQIIRGSLICLFALVVALVLYVLDLVKWFPATSAYAEPILPWIIAVLSINAIINGFESTKYAVADRNMALGMLTSFELISQVSGMACMITWAVIDRSIWALVCGSIVTSLMRVILGNVLMPGERNRLHWDKNAFQEILNFGKWIFFTSILGFLAANGDRLILGSLVDAKMLGMYSIAFFMVSALREIFSKLVGKVAFPALSEVARERPAMLKQVYYKFRHPLDAATLLAAGMLFYSGHLVINIFYDHRYFSAGHMLEILSIMFFETRYMVAGQCFMALGKPKLMVPIIVIQLLAIYGLMPIAFSLYGFDGALWVAGGGVLLTIPVTLYITYKLGLLDFNLEMRALPWLIIGLALGWVVNQVSLRIGWPI